MVSLGEGWEVDLKLLKMTDISVKLVFGVIEMNGTLPKLFVLVPEDAKGMTSKNNSK